MAVWRSWLGYLSAVCLVAVSVPTANAGLLSKILREAGDAGKKAGKNGDLDLPDGMGSLLTRLPDGDRSAGRR